MKFKLLHVRPHVWFLKQQETVGKSTSDDSSNDGSAPAFKRSASLKLVKSDTKLLPVTKRSQRHDKGVRVCTVVDAGCTCRATMTSSQHKQKKTLLAQGVEPVGDAGTLHESDKYAVCRPWRAPYLSSFKLRGSDKSSSSMVSRLVCKTSDDVLHKHGDCERTDNTVTAHHNIKDTTKLKRPSVMSMPDAAARLNVHALECKLRNAGLEERRSRKKHGDGGPLISSGVSISSGSADTMTDTCNTVDTSEMQEVVMSSNPEYDIVDDADYSGSMDMSLEELRASIAQTKLANRRLLSKQARLFKSIKIEIDAASSDQSGMSTTTACSSPASNGSFLDGSFRRRASKPDGESLNDPALLGAENGQESVKHVDGGTTDVRRYLRPHAHLDGISPRQVNQLQTWCGDDCTSLDESELSTAFVRRAMSRKITSKVKNQGASKTVMAHGNAVRDGHATGTRITLNTMHCDAYIQSGDGGASLHGSISRQGKSNLFTSDNGDAGGGQDKRVVSSSSCEIQVLSDYTANMEGHATQCTLHGGPLSSSPSPSKSPRKKKVPPRPDVKESMMMTRSNSGGAVAMVKSSYDPRHDFKESMLEMVVAKQLRGPHQLQQLLQSYLSLNPSHYHSTIMEVFDELCSELFT